jgi:hypothetical protein
MDPYLEAGNLWSGLHLQLINGIVEDLQPQLVPRYVARPQQRVVLGALEDPIGPDVLVEEREPAPWAGGTLVAARPAADEIAVPEFIEVPELIVPHRFVRIVEAGTLQVVTTIEVLSPWNKVGRGREQYRRKQERVLLTDVNLVEIDLLRRGAHAVAAPAERVAPSDYRVCIHRAGARGFHLLRFGLRDPLPNVGIPLRADDEDVVLHLGDVFTRCYDTGAYQYLVDYGRDPEPPLPADDAAWARDLLAADAR